MQSYTSQEEDRIGEEEIKTVLQTGELNLKKNPEQKTNIIKKTYWKRTKEIWKPKESLVRREKQRPTKLIFEKPKFLYAGQQLAQREVFSMATSLFDPNGLISPFAIRIGCILQKTIKEGRNWEREESGKNQPVSECYQQELQEWMEEMTSIQNSRYRIPNTNGKHQLHMFTDASKNAIAAIVYVRTTNVNWSSTSQYLITKTKVAPLKQLSNPKLELIAATFGAEQADFCESEVTTTKLKANLITQHCYT